MWFESKNVLPEVDGNYLVVINYASEPTILYFDTLGRMWMDLENPSDRYSVTHWQCLPSVPSVNDINLNNITYGKSIHIFENISDYSEQEIVSAIYCVLQMPSIMAVTKNNLVTALRYLFDIHYEVSEDVD